MGIWRLIFRTCAEIHPQKCGNRSGGPIWNASAGARRCRRKIHCSNPCPTVAHVRRRCDLIYMHLSPSPTTEGPSWTAWKNADLMRSVRISWELRGSGENCTDCARSARIRRDLRGSGEIREDR